MQKSPVALVLLVSLYAGGCAGPPPRTGHWVGDLRRPAAAERIEVEIDSTGRSARVTLASWALDKAPATALPSTGDSVAFMVTAEKDTIRLVGIARGGAWHGEARRGADVLPIELQRLHPMADSELREINGTYRTGGGHLLGISPFSEFGSGPQLVDYFSGRIGPLFPIAADRYLWGRSLVAPLYPADTLEIRRGPNQEVSGIVLVEGQQRSPADRVTTGDSEVEFSNGPVTLRGTLTVPPRRPPYPAVVLVHGSNAQTRDSFGPWARYFAGLGFAVLAFDKRGTGGSTGDWKQADFNTLAGDVLAGVRYLKSRPDMRGDRIGLWGASQAGWIMPIVAAQAPADIAFLVVHAGSGTTVRQEGVLYLRNELRFGGLPESSVDIGIRYQMLDDSVSKTDGGWERLQSYYDEHKAAETWLWPPRPADDWFRPYYRMLMDFDPVPFWRQVHCPVLFFYGQFDANVPPRESWAPIERALRDAGNRAITQVVLPEANHLFLKAKTGARDEYPGLSRFVLGYFNVMAIWLDVKTR